MSASQHIQLPHATLDLVAGEVRSETQTTSLSDREVKLLQILAQSVGESVDYREILSAFNLSDGSRTALTDWVRRLRKKIEPDPKNPTVLLRHYGGRFELHTATSEPAEPAPQTLVEAPLVGRAACIETVHGLLTQGHRLLNLVGPAGVGKTRVAQRIATQATASGRFIDGVVFCELAACTNVSDALYALAKSLGVSLSGQHTVVDAVQTLGEAVSRRGRTLCVVDNVEHLAHSLREPLSALYRMGAQIQWILTSRSRMGIASEQMVPIEALAVEDGVALLTQRMEALGASIPDGAEAELPELIRALDGSPLAILVAAGRLSSGDWSAGAASLKASLAQLMEGDASLSATLEWSWNLLNPSEQQALVQMGVFRGGATLEMAEQVIDAGEDWVEDLLMSLVDQSLLWVRTDSDAPRLTLYESVRAFVGVRFPHPSPELADRFVEAMAQLNAGGRASMASMDEEVVRIRRLEQEASNLWVAQSLARGRSGDSTRWALEAVIWVWSRQGRLVALKDALREWLDDESVQGLIRLDAQTAWVSQCLHLRDVDSPKALVEQLSAQEQGESTDQTYLKTLHPVLEYTLRAGPLSEHIALAESLLERLQTLSPLVRARLQHTLGIAYRKEGRIEEGVEMQRLALATPGHAHWKPQAQSALAVGLVFLGKTAEAVPEFEAVYDWQNRFGGTLHQIAASTNYGRVCLLSGQFERGWSVLRDGWDKALKLAPIRLCEINGFNYVGSCLITGRDAVAEVVFREAVPRAEAIDSVDILTTVLSLRAVHRGRSGDLAGFIDDWDRALSHLRNGWMLNDDEIEAVKSAYQTLMSADTSTWHQACESVKEVLERPYIRLDAKGLAPRTGSGGHHLHVLILQEWVERGQEPQNPTR